jgi:hypothetical protein
MPTPPPREIRTDIVGLLCERFNTAEELRDFLLFCEVDGIPLGELLVNNLQDPNVSLREYASATMRLLMEHGLLRVSFFGALDKIEPMNRTRPLIAMTTPEQPSLVHTCPPPFAPFACHVGRGGEMTTVLEHLAGGRSVILIGGRRTGKTALTLQLPARLGVGHCLRVDVGAWPGGDEPALLEWLGRTISPDTAACTSRSQLRHLFASLAPLTLVIDEAERLLEREWTNPFFAWLRHLDAELGPNLKLLLTGGPELARYRDEDDPSYPGGSAVLNAAEFVYLEPLDHAARAILVSYLGAPVDQEMLFQAAGGHPWLLTQILAQMWNGASLQAALNHVNGQLDNHVRTWAKQMGSEALSFLHSRLPDAGVPLSAFDAYPYPGGALQDYTAEWNTLKSMCVVDIAGDSVRLGPALILQRWRRRGQQHDR